MRCRTRCWYLCTLNANYFLALAFLYDNILRMHEVKALARLRVCASSSEPSLLTDAKIIIKRMCSVVRLCGVKNANFSENVEF